jgi:2-polyprenyl-3-methyl-5-hydroxy-6-metoxy-1,4-benzoquinol methylase
MQINFFIKIAKKMEILSAVACRLTQLTGKSNLPIHPKHLIKKKHPDYFKLFNKHDFLLDLGCHQGEISYRVAPLVNKIIAVDCDKKALERANAQKQNGMDIDFKYLDLEKKLPFKNGQFNVVLFLDVLEHLNQRHQAMMEVYRILKKDGYLILSLPNRETKWKQLQKKAEIFYYSDPDHKIEFTKEEIIKLCENHGFKIIELIPNSYDTWISPLIDLIGGVSLGIYRRFLLWKQKQVLRYPEDCIGYIIVARKI